MTNNSDSIEREHTRQLPRPIVKTFSADVSLENLWDHWTKPELLQKWLCLRANVNLKQNGAFELFWDLEDLNINSTIGCIITSIEPKKRLVFNWKGPVIFADLMNNEPLPTFVEISFNTQNKNSFELMHFGWSNGERWLSARSWQESAWESAFEELLRILNPET